MSRGDFVFDMKVFGQRMKEQREKKSVTQEFIAKTLGIGKSRVSEMESGKNTTTFTHLIELADYFEVSTDYLLGRTDNPEVNR